VRTAGTEVVVVARPNQLSRALRSVADEIRVLPDIPEANSFALTA